MKSAEDDSKMIEKKLNGLLDSSREELYRDPIGFLRKEGIEISPESEKYLAELIRSYSSSQDRIPGSTLRNGFDDRISGGGLELGLIKRSSGLELGIPAKRSSGLELGAPAKRSSGLELGAPMKRSSGLELGAPMKRSSGLELGAPMKRSSEL
jgi:hypothetical protein